MQVKSIKTHIITFGDSLENILDKYIMTLEEKSIIAITSKILSVIEGRYVSKANINKYDLIKQEADLLLKTDQNPYNIFLTIKDGLLIPSAGIDESNVDDVYVLYPAEPFQSAELIWRHLRTKHQIKELGVIITDSHTTIMRKGVTGIALSWCGFEPVYSYVGKPDIYGKALKVTQVNIVDALAVSAVFLMGEANEQTPISIIQDAPHIVFLDHKPTIEERNNMIISLEEDLYAPLLKAAAWDKKT
jgi:putative folate metabolism gamma-glutamate ligase